MKKTILGLMLVLTLSGCIGREGNIPSQPAIESSSSSTVKSYPTETETSSSSTVSATSSTTVPASTSTTMIGQCENLEDILNKSACYLAKAVSGNNRSLCLKIDSSLSRNLCLEQVGLDDEESSVIYGTVNKRSPAGPVIGVELKAISTTIGGVTTDMTSGGGKYTIPVRGGDTYNVSLAYNGRVYSSIVKAKRNWEHQVDFIVA